MRESYIERKCTQYSKTKGWENLKVYKKGFPDRLFFKKNKYFFVEFKGPGGKLSIVQKKTIEYLKDSKIKVYVIDNLSIFMDIIEENE